MTIITLTLKEHPSGGEKVLLQSDVIPVYVGGYRLIWTHRLVQSSVCVSSVGVALSRGHGKYFFRGNVSVEAGTSFQKSYTKSPNAVRGLSLLSCFLVGLLYQSLQAGTAEALLTCVFQASVISNSQMSPWQMNGNTGVVEVGIHALCRLFLPAHQGCERPVM